MKVLVACEESQTVCTAFRERGHEAYSCDLQEPSGGHPEWHIHGDALQAIKGGRVTTMDGAIHDVGKWDLLIAHPPCTFLTNSSAVRMRKNGLIVEQRYKNAMKAKDLFMAFLNADVPRIAIENPLPLQLVKLPRYTQMIEPYQFGHPYSKKTCLWLKGLPQLCATNIRTDYEPYVNGGCKDAHGNYRRFQGRRERDQKTRSKTFPGIAEAMAEQWGKVEGLGPVQMNLFDCMEA